MDHSRKRQLASEKIEGCWLAYMLIYVPMFLYGKKAAVGSFQ